MATTTAHSPAVATSLAAPLAQLESDINALLGTGPNKTVDLANLAAPVPGLTESSIPGLSALLGKLTSKLAPITGAQLTLGPQNLTLSGTLQWVDIDATFMMTAVFSVSGTGNLQVVVTCSQGTSPITLLALTKLLGHSVTSYTPDVSLTALALVFGTASGDFSFTGAANWPVPFGNPGVQPSSLNVAANLTFTTTSAAITGVLQVSGQTFQVSCDLAKDANTLTASWTSTGTPLTWDTLVAAGRAPGAKLPAGITGPSFTQIDLTINFSDDSLTFTTQAQVDVFLLIKKGTNDWGFAVGIHQESSAFQLGSWSTDLNCMDFLSLSDGCLVFSTYADDPFVFPTVPSTTAVAPFSSLLPGLNFGASINFPEASSGRQRTLSRIFGSASALLSGYLGRVGGQPSASIKAAVEGLTIPKTPLKLVAPSLALTLATSEVDVLVSGGIIIPLGKGQTPLTIDASIDVNGLDGLTIMLDGQANYVLPAPVGLHGVVLQNAGGSIGIPDVPDPTIKVGFEVQFALGGNTDIADGNPFAFGLGINPATLSAEPLYLVGRFGQRITLSLLLNTLAPQIEVILQQAGTAVVSINALLNQFILESASFSYAALAGQTLPDGTSVPLGCSMSASILFLSFEMSGALSLVYDGNNPKDSKGATGASGSFTMSPIVITATIAGSSQTLVSITGVPANTGPAFSFDTNALLQSQTSNNSATPACLGSASIDVNILGATTNLNASLDTTGLNFKLAMSVRGVSLTLSCLLETATGLGASVIVPATPPLKVSGKVELYAPNGTDLGTLNFEGSLSGSLFLTVNTAGASIQLNLHLTLADTTLIALTFSFSASPNDLADLASTLEKEIEAQGSALFNSLGSDLGHLKTLGEAGFFTATSAVESEWQDVASATTYAASTTVQTAEKGWNSLQSTLKNLGSTVLSDTESFFHVRSAPESENDAIQQALSNPILQFPPLSVRQFSFLAPLGRSGGNDAMLAGLSRVGQPYLITWEHKLGGGWKSGRALPAPSTPTLGFSSLSMCVARSGDTEVIGLGVDGTPYIISYLPTYYLTQVLDKRIGWQAGGPMPCPPTQNKFTMLGQSATPSGDLQIVGLDAQKHAYLVCTLQQQRGGWFPGMALPCPANQSQFNSIGACTTRNGDVQVYGVGVDQVAYIIAWLPNGTSNWQAGGPMACPDTQNQFSQLLYGAPGGASMFIGLGTDGRPYEVASMDSGGAWHNGRLLPALNLMATYKSLAVGSLSSGDFQVFGIGTDNMAYIACYLPQSSGQWTPGIRLPMPPGQDQFVNLSFNLNGTGDGEVCGLGTDAKPYLVSYIGSNSGQGWQPGICMNIA